MTRRSMPVGREIGRREIGRRLLAADRAHRAALPAWRRRLERAFEQADDGGATAPLLGLPDRRGFLQVGGVAIAGAALLAACGGDDDGTTVPMPSSTTAPPGTIPGPTTDVVLANTAISLEILAVDTYQVALDTGLVESAAIVEAMRMFQAHHAEHRAVLAAVVEAAGGEPYTTANAVVKAAFVDPALYSAATEADVVRLGYDIEQTAAQTYTHSATLLSSADLRQRAATIGSVEQRHATVLELAGDLRTDKPAFAPAENPLPSDAMITG